MADAAFGKYGLIAELGHGGMADVYLAVARGPAGFSKLVVIKRVRANLVDDPEFRQMLVDEARLAGRLNHPNVVQTNEVGQVGDQFFIAMEYLEGQPLNRILHRSANQVFPFPMHLRVLADALSGLHHAHELKDYDGTALNVVHRDATPQNIFVTYDGHVKVVDFGIAKAANRSSETRTGIIKGKLMYMSPEQAMGAEIDRRADVFSVGVMLWEAAAGQRMWAGLEEFTVMQRLINGDIRYSAREVNPEVSEALDQIIKKAIAYDPEKRYETAADFQKALEEFIDTERQRIGHRELAVYVSDLFKDRRAHQRTIIERQLAALKSLNADQLQALSPGEISAGAFSLASLSDGPSRDVAPVTVTPGGDILHSSETVPDLPLAGSTTGARRRRRTRITGVILTSVAVLAGAAWATSFRQSSSPPASAADAHATATTAAPPSEPTSITLTVRANPVEAQFRIDNGDAITNPLAGKFPRDNREHKIEIFAPSYVTKTISVTFTNDRDINESLEKLPAPKPDKATPPHRAAPPPARARPTASAAPQATPTQDELNTSF